MAWLEAVTYLATLTYKFFRGDSEERGGRRREEEYNNYHGTEWNPQYRYGSGQIDSGYDHGREYYEKRGSKKHRRGKPQEDWHSYRIRDQNGDTEIDVQYPYGSEQIDSGYGHGREYYEQRGSEKHCRGDPHEGWYSYPTGDQRGNTEMDVQYPYGSEQIDSGYGRGREYYEQGGSERHRRGEPHEGWYSYPTGDQRGDTEMDVARSQRVKKKKGGGFLRRRVDYEESGVVTKKYVDRRGKQVIEQKPYSSRMYEEDQYLPDGR